MSLGSRDILDHGHVALLEIMGSDSTIAESARVSYGKHGKDATKSNNDEQLIRYLLRHRHTSPFEMCEARFYFKVPIFVARQLVRHRTASLNEISGRYSVLPNDMYVPEIDQCGPQSNINHQGRADVVDGITAMKSRQDIAHANEHAYGVYDALMTRNISKEIARIVQPLSIYTEMYWKCDLHNLFHFLKLRLDHHAQYEIRVLAQAMYELIQPKFPMACGAFEDYILHSHTLSSMEQDLLSHLLMRLSSMEIDDAVWKISRMSERECNEFRQWINTLTGK